MTARAPLPLLVLLALAAACTGRVWSAGELARRHPVLERHTGHRLEDMHAYVLPRAGVVWLFTCRWSTEAPVGVWLSPDFEDEERRIVKRALDAWQRAGLGLRFAEVGRAEARILVEAVADPVDRAAGAGTGAGRAVVDCGLDDRAHAFDTGRLAAELVRARVELARGGRDVLGRPRAHAPEELAGAALHELGHALGFQGHAQFGGTAMRRAPERVRALGRKLLADEPFHDPSLAALYALPSGSVLAARPVEAWRTDLVDRMARRAREEALEGPFVRVGDSASRIFWRRPDEPDDEYGLAVVNLAKTYVDPAQVAVLAEPRTLEALSPAGAAASGDPSGGPPEGASP